MRLVELVFVPKPAVCRYVVTRQPAPPAGEDPELFVIRRETPNGPPREVMTDRLHGIIAWLRTEIVLNDPDYGATPHRMRAYRIHCGEHVARRRGTRGHGEWEYFRRSTMKFSRQAPSPKDFVAAVVSASKGGAYYKSIFKFEPRDVWVGLYWNATNIEYEYAKDFVRSTYRRRIDIFICIIPCVLIRFAVQVGKPRWKAGDFSAFNRACMGSTVVPDPAKAGHVCPCEKCERCLWSRWTVICSQC